MIVVVTGRSLCSVTVVVTVPVRFVMVPTVTVVVDRFAHLAVNPAVRVVAIGLRHSAVTVLVSGILLLNMGTTAVAGHAQVLAISNDAALLDGLILESNVSVKACGFVLGF